MLPRAPTACWETVGNKRETSVESGGPENPKHTARQSETSGGQVGDKCRTMQLRASTAYWETSGRQLQNHGAQSTRSASHSGPGHLQHTGRQVGDKSRIRRSKASTPFFESGEPGSQLGDSRSSAEPGRGRQLGDRCSTGDKRRLMRPRAPAAYFETVGVKRWATWRQVWEKRGRQVQNHMWPTESETSGRQAGYKRRIMRPKASTDKWDTSAELCGPEHPQRT